MSAAFWSWFQDNRDRMSVIPRASTSAAVRKRLFDELNGVFEQSYPELVAEVGLEGEMAKLVVSADGVRDRFAAVIACVNAAPAVPGWRVVAFRQRQDFEGDIRMFGRSFPSRDMRLRLRPDGGKVEIEFVLKSDTDLDDARLAQIGYIVLDSLFGEWDVEIHVGGIHRRRIKRADGWDSDALDLPAARDEFDRLLAPHRKAH